MFTLTGRPDMTIVVDRGRKILEIVSRIYFMVSEINILTKFRQTICYSFKINCTSFEKLHGFFNKYAMKNNLQNKM